MNKKQVIDLLKEHSGSGKSIRTAAKGKIRSYVIGLTDLRKLARKIGRDHELALELWQSDVYEARILGLLIDDPKRISREQAELQVEQLDEPVFAHVFSSCDASLAKVPYIVELAVDWIDSKDKQRRSCGWGLLSEIASSRKKSDPDDAFFLGYIDRIHRDYKEKGIVEGAYALLCMGKRNKQLNAAALKVAKIIGPVEYDSDKKCDPFDIEAHLTKDHLQRRLGIR